MKLNLKDLKKAEEDAAIERERQNAEREMAFRKKVAIQQFMNNNGPLFREFARAGTPIDDMVEGNVIKEPAYQAMNLAVLVAAKLLMKEPEEVTAAEAKPFRREAAEYVASKWRAKKKLDIESAATEISSAVRLADKSWDHNPWGDEAISNDASLMMTAAGVAGALSGKVDIYDFRLGRAEVMSRILKVVVETSSQSASDMLSKDASAADKRNLTQTLANKLSSLMEACYERKAREVSFYLHKKDESERLSWYKKNDPVSDIIAEFKDWAVCFTAYAIAASRGLSPQPNGEEKTLAK